MRRLAPAICFALAIAVYWAIEHDTAGIMSLLPASVLPYAKLAAQTVIWFAAAWVATEILAEVIEFVARRRGANRLPKLLAHIGAIVIFFCAGLVVVSLVFNQPLGGMLATSGVLAAIIGFSIQKTIADIIAGISLNVEQSINLGDWIETSTGAIGKAVEITWRTTHLHTIDDRLIIVPNSTLSGGAFVNLSAPERYLRFNKTISIDYSLPTERICRILEAAMKATDGVLQRPAPVVLVNNCGESGIDYNLYFWTADYPEHFLISSNVLSNALKFLDQAGISPVFPKQDITLFEPSPRQIDRKLDVGGILRRMPFFTAFDADAMEQIERGWKLREFRPDAVVVREGDAGASLFVVIAGLLNVSKEIQGASRHLGRIVPGDLFGEMSLLTGAARSATVTAASHATLVEIDKPQLEPILAKHPEAIAALGQFVAERTAANQSTLASSTEEKREIESIGVAAFIGKKIAEFFGAALT